METDPSIWQAILAALRGIGQTGRVDERAAAAQAASSGVAAQMPGAVMPHDALARKERERAMIEAMMRGAR